MQTTKDYVKLFFKQNKFVAFVSALVFIILSTTYSIVSWIMQVIWLAIVHIPLKVYC